MQRTTLITCLALCSALSALGGCATHAEHLWIEIKTDDHTLRSSMGSDMPGDDPCAARHIQHMLTRLHIRRPNQVS